MLPGYRIEVAGAVGGAAEAARSAAGAPLMLSIAFTLLMLRLCTASAARSLVFLTGPMACGVRRHCCC